MGKSNNYLDKTQKKISKIISFFLKLFYEISTINCTFVIVQIRP
jgi:hypothetical protein